MQLFHLGTRSLALHISPIRFYCEPVCAISETKCIGLFRHIFCYLYFGFRGNSQDFSSGVQSIDKVFRNNFSKGRVEIGMPLYVRQIRPGRKPRMPTPVYQRPKNSQLILNPAVPACQICQCKTCQWSVMSENLMSKYELFKILRFRPLKPKRIKWNLFLVMFYSQLLYAEYNSLSILLQIVS